MLQEGRRKWKIKTKQTTQEREQETQKKKITYKASSSGQKNTLTNGSNCDERRGERERERHEHKEEK